MLKTSGFRFVTVALTPRENWSKGFDESC